MRPDMFHLIVERPRLVNPKRAGSHYPRGRPRFEATFGRKDAFAVATREPGRRELARVSRRKTMR